MNGIHDVGGMDGMGPVQWEKDEPVFHERWESRVRAIHMLLLRKRRYFHLDESRHYIERMHPVYYLGSTYYDRWLLRMETMLVERGLITEEELQARTAELASGDVLKPDLEPFRKVLPPADAVQRSTVLETASGALEKTDSIRPKFAPGTAVKAKVLSKTGHTRIPRYVRGKVGTIEKIHGVFILPDTHVHEGITLYQPVYRVRFNAQDLWGKDAAPKDKLYIELWEDYLEPIS